MAQENVIRIISEDGKVQELVIEAPAPVVAEPVVEEVQPVVEPEAEAVPVVEPDSVLQVEPEAEPVEAESVAPEPKAEPVQKEEEEKVEVVPVPPRKPALPPEAGMGHRNPQAVDAMQERAGISREQAIALALEHAPPARTIRAWPRVYNDRPVYEVIFKTEQGDHVIYIDQADGHVINP